MTTDDIMAKVHMAFDQVSLKFEEEKKKFEALKVYSFQVIMIETKSSVSL